jgi:hypothetical protein
MDTHNAFRPSTHPELWGQTPSPVADRREAPPDLDDDGGEWHPAPFEARVAMWCFVGMVGIIVVSAVAGWLWPL